MSKKSSKYNAFARFMFDYKKAEEAKGRQMDMRMTTVEAGELWSKLTEEEKTKYKQTKLLQKESYTDKLINLNNHGLPINQTASSVEISFAKHPANRIIGDSLGIEVQAGLDSMKFYFISVSYFLKREATYIWPCELALCEFSIRDGVTRTFHTLINPGKIPLGFAGDVIRISETTHRIPPPNEHTEGETDYKKLFKLIMEFVGATEFDRAKIPPFYAGLNNEEIDSAMITLDIIAQENNFNFNAFSVFPIDMLFYKLQHKCIMVQSQLKIPENFPLSSQVYARHCLETDDDFMFCSIGCEYHNDNDVAYVCCLSKVKRWGYCIAKYCIDNRFEVIPGRHCPETYEKMKPKSESSQSTLANSMGFLKIQAIKSAQINLNNSLSSLKSSTQSMATSTRSNNVWFKKLLEGREKTKCGLTTTDSEATIDTQK